MKRLKFFLLLFIFFGISSQVIGSKHPIHVSLTNIDYLKAEKKFKITIKLFIDDFEGVIKQNYQVSLFLNKPNQHAQADDYITQYIKNHFYIRQNNVNITATKMLLHEKKFNHEAVWLYFYVENVNCSGKIEIFNSLMNDYFPDQKNLTIFNDGVEDRAFSLTKNEEMVSFQY